MRETKVYGIPITGPPHMEEAMWYILIGFFIMIWMWMFIWA